MEELRQLTDAAEAECLSGYGCDGDEHWTPAAVREWWRDRGRIREYLADRRGAWEADDEKSGRALPPPPATTPRTSTVSWPRTSALISSGSTSGILRRRRTGCHGSSRGQ
ncbi:hypothetical protein GCM10010507_11690 [Streptomyces cinnamoneus]|uniref:Uncharacterized protein n=1 Tax=Streptomyces cinnamoneus TaxID=53446 RepID=A0A918WFP2_STRCJ|nr:hypothetical protein GCM10010507_11690 [Streptomyces cinnamoneus]